LKFYASVRIDIRKTEVIKVGTESVGNRTKAKIVKNKVAPPFKVAEFDIMYGEGVSHEGDVLDIGTDIDIVTKGGAWYSYGDVKLGNGREKAKKYLADNPALCREIENKIRVYYNMPELEKIEQASVEASEEVNPVEEISLDDVEEFDDNTEMKLEPEESEEQEIFEE
jgi:recombination protein RecA